MTEQTSNLNPDLFFRRLCNALALGLIISLVLAGCSRDDSAAIDLAAAPQPEDVGTFTLKPERIAFSTELPGRTVAPAIAEIRPQVGGIVQKRLFIEGAQVQEGQVLYQLDAAPFQAAHVSALAGVRKAESTLGDVYWNPSTSGTF